MANNILPLAKTKVVDFSKESLQNFWMTKSDNEYPIGQDFKGSIIQLLKSVSEGVVCIQSASITDNQVIKQIFDTARDREVRIYILVNQYSPELDLLKGRCLIRCGLTNTGSFILANPSSNQKVGLFFGGLLTELSLASSNQILCKIKGKEIGELFRHFCFQFWETAKSEVKDEGEHNNVDSKPIEVFHNKAAYGERDFVYSTLFDFVQTKVRYELWGSLIVPLGKENENPILITPIEKIEIGSIHLGKLLSFDEFDNHAPDFSDNGTACRIEFKWMNVPFYLPETSLESPLYARWNQESKRIGNFLDSILAKIDAGENKEKTISQKLSRFFLGKKTAFRNLKSDVEELRKVDYASITEKEIKEKINQINGIHKQVENEIEEIEQEDRKAKLEEEITSIQERRNDKNNLLASKQADLSDKQKVIKEKLKVFLEEHKIDENLLNKVKSEWQQQSGQKNKQKNPKEAQEAETKFNQLNEIQNLGFIKKIEDEIENLKRDLKRINDEIRIKEVEKSKSSPKVESKSALEEFVTSQPSKQNSTDNKLLTVTDLPQLPRTGKLFQLNNQTYLAIEYWEQYDQGKSEAGRLKANLCAIKN